MSNPNCATCRWYVGSTIAEDYGECRFNPPMGTEPIYHNGQSETTDVASGCVCVHVPIGWKPCFQKTRSDLFCGQHKEVV